MPKQKHGNTSGTQSSRRSTGAAVEEKMDNNSPDKEVGLTRSSISPKTTRSAWTPMADAFLYNDPRPGYAGPGLGWLDGGGSFTLSRQLPGVIFCLKIAFVERVQLGLSVPSRAVTDLVSWLHRQFFGITNYQ